MSYTPDTTLDIPPFTFAYRAVQGLQVSLDVHLPPFRQRDSTAPGDTMDSHSSESPAIVPALLYFHGGGLTVGNRKSWFPHWMQKRVTEAGYAFISADYRLMPPSTAHDIIDDIKDAFRFIREDLNSQLSAAMYSAGCRSASCYLVDPNAIAVAGSSAGGQCALYAAMHVSPKPKAMVLMYSMGGDYLTPQYLIEKTVPFFRGREMPDRAEFTQYLHPLSDTLGLISDSPLSYHGPSWPVPGYPANARMLLSRLYLQLGILLDYLTGEHKRDNQPSLSDILREALGSDKTDLAHSTGSDAYDEINERLERLIPERHRPLFPQFSVTSDWPPTYLAHGALDSAVLVHESRNMHKLLKTAGVDVTLSVLEGEEHSFDYEPTAEAIYGSSLFDSIGEFLKEHLEKARGGVNVA